MAGNMDLITAGKKTSTNKRKKIHCEEVSDRIQLSSKESINRAYYLKLVDNPEVADTYVKKQKFVQYSLGVKEGCNMRNPHTVSCHVPGCMGLIKLKAANNISSIVEHWIIHSNPTKSLYHESCCIVLRRLEFLKFQSQNYWKDMTISLDELEHEHNHLGQSLAIQALMDKCFIAHQGKKFRGSSLMADLGIMQGIAEGDPDVLSRLSPAKSIETYFNSDKS